MKTIELTKGQVTIVDDEDFEELSRFKLSKERGIEIRKVRVPGSVYATVGSYHLDILRELFGT
jgi:hypothetical protein